MAVPGVRAESQVVCGHSAAAHCLPGITAGNFDTAVAGVDQTSSGG